MLCAIDASLVFQVLTRPLVGYNWVVSGMVVGVLDSVMDSVLDPNSLRLRSRISRNANSFASQSSMCSPLSRVNCKC
jgi:hypothetical protein